MSLCFSRARSLDSCRRLRSVCHSLAVLLFEMSLHVAISSCLRHGRQSATAAQIPEAACCAELQNWGDLPLDTPVDFFPFHLMHAACLCVVRGDLLLSNFCVFAGLDVIVWVTVVVCYANFWCLLFGVVSTQPP